MGIEEYNNIQPGNALKRHIEFIRLIFAYADRFKVLHWAAANDSMHKRIDEFYAEIEKFKDNIAENVQGVLGQFRSDEVVRTINLDGLNGDAETCIVSLRDDVEDYLRSVNSLEHFEGVKNECSNFIETIYKFIYLFKLAK